MTAAEAIFASAKDAIHNSAFKHRKSGTISGMEEAASGWLTANYIMKEKVREGWGSLGGWSISESVLCMAKYSETCLWGIKSVSGVEWGVCTGM